mmetsp:Transcript_31954/g.49538  ORF Transcript_31954/g.49538 Transcript_31954/m.49538 type:complete len:320 (-) Transcript_31954:457-1416(-)
MNTAQSMRQNFSVTGTPNLFTKQISHLVQGEFATNRVGGWDSLDDVVVAKCDADILGNVDGMQDIRSGARYSHLQDGLVFEQSGGSQLHLVAQSLHFGRRNINTDQRVTEIDLCGFLSGEELWSHVGVNNGTGIIFVLYLDRKRSVGRGAVLAEHCNNGVKHNVGLGQIRSCTLDKYIFGIQSDLGMVSVDNGRKGQNPFLTIQNNRVQRRILDDGHVWFQVLSSRVRLVVLHQILGVEATIVRSQGYKLDFRSGPGVISERSLDGIQIVRSNGHQSSLSTQIAMKLILQLDEGLVSLGSEGDVFQYSRHDKGTNGIGP